MAPSVNNYQPWKFIAVTNRKLLQKMAQKVAEKIASIPSTTSHVAGNVKSQVEWFATFFADAPALIAITMESYETVLEKGVTLSHEEINQMRKYPDMQSLGACIENMLLSAVDMGYGACWLSAPVMAEESLEVLLGITPPYKLIAFVAVGKPLNPPLPKPRKSLDDIFSLIE
jgi:nitroreductase